MHRRHALLLALHATLLLGLTGTPAAGLDAGWTRLELPVPPGSYAWAYVPPALAGKGPAPAVVFLHGAGATPDAWRPHLAPHADALGLVLLLPRAGSDVGFGVGPDDAIVEATLRLAGDAVDPRRVALAGHSAGGAYAIELAYSVPGSYRAVLAIASPYRTVVQPAGPGAPAPLRFLYGTQDPNYLGAFPPLAEMLTRLGVPWEADVRPGYGHSNLPPEALEEGFRFLVEQPVPGCVPTDTALCAAGRFRVQARWETADTSGDATAVQHTADAGAFWFFTPTNLELDVKVLEGCSTNGRWWVFAAGLTDVGVEIVVTDTATGRQQRYERPRGKPFVPVQDTAAFDC